MATISAGSFPRLAAWGVAALLSLASFATEPLATATASPSPDPAKLCYPPYWGGLLPGFSTDAELTKLYGAGLFPETGHDGTRYYTDGEKQITLIVSLATDRIVADIVVRSGYHPPPGISPDNLTAMISPELEPTISFGNYHSLSLGSTMAAVQQNLGPPHSVWTDDDTGSTNWVYESQCSCELQAGITFGFEENTLTSVSFWYSQG